MKFINKILLTSLIAMGPHSYSVAQQRELCDYFTPVLTDLAIKMPDSLYKPTYPVNTQCYPEQKTFIQQQSFVTPNYCDYFAGSFLEQWLIDEQAKKDKMIQNKKEAILLLLKLSSNEDGLNPQ